MDLFLMQHGEAMADTDDPARPLTESGRAAVERVATRTQAAGVRLDRCLHSGKLRAEQTALILAGALGGGTKVEARDGLGPNDPVDVVAQWLQESADDRSVAVVGHLPFLDRLASLLISKDQNAQVIQFQMGGLVKLVPKRQGAGFAVAWALPPEVV